MAIINSEEEYNFIRAQQGRLSDNQSYFIGGSVENHNDSVYPIGFHSEYLTTQRDAGYQCECQFSIYCDS